MLKVVPEREGTSRVWSYNPIPRGLMTREMGVAPYVQWIDVFCERGAFDEAQSRRVLAAGIERGLGVRVHGNQLAEGPGVALAVEMGAASVDHVNYLSDTRGLRVCLGSHCVESLVLDIRIESGLERSQAQHVHSRSARYCLFSQVRFEPRQLRENAPVAHL